MTERDKSLLYCPGEQQLPMNTPPIMSNTQPATLGGLNVIALVSGGKDSLFSILHCIRNGHKVIALANLHPELKPNTSTAEKAAENDDDGEKEEEEDIDSFMYQTIGHSVIPLYEEALGIPLYRAPITGGAVDTSRIYRHDAVSQSSEKDVLSGSDAVDGEADETESLVPLLTRIMKAHPEVNAVSAGAILSTYQRTRIENVAGRLGLTPLAWLWNYPSLPAPAERVADPATVREAGLLEDMAAAGRRIFGALSLVRGGEYETLAVDGPGFLWKKRILVEKAVSRVADGGVAYTCLKGARCVSKSDGQEKEQEQEQSDIAPSDIRRPALFDGKFATLLNDLSTGPADANDSTAETNIPLSPSPSPSPTWTTEPVSRLTKTTWTISNLIAPEAGPSTTSQMSAISSKIQKALSSSPSNPPHSTEDIIFATVLLRTMDDFTPMNKIYVSLFQKPNPPARATVACGDTLPDGVNVMISFVVDRGARNARQGLHVQSRSYWAPANIGPYSQALSIPLELGESGSEHRQNDQTRLVYVAGQIPLEPASMEVAASTDNGSESAFGDYSHRATLALQHMWRIGEAMQVNWWAGAVAFLVRRGNDQTQIRTQARIAWELWKNIHTAENTGDDDGDDDDEEGPQFDAWDIKYGRQTEDVVAQTWKLPDFGILGSSISSSVKTSTTSVSPFLAVEVDQLPRGSDIEWQGLGYKCGNVSIEDQVDRTASIADGKYAYTCIEISSGESDSKEKLAAILKSLSLKRRLSQAVLYTTQRVTGDFWVGQVVPCRSVWGREGKELFAGVVLQEEIEISN
ncbi:hypothetical protein N7481_007602 [Penicillium waksmanii]|uniref:uncharacterized protein n=1 Tax=Penicillium waksmanii TaxID=69791 RepID=UPI002546FC50|nr:uncharacterized protein N7481_007602 [Penicillium waksmanii]KAJ5980304.1 hypothetical protein N7481_007602 [Penicillium waksmanii]